MNIANLLSFKRAKIHLFQAKKKISPQNKEKFPYSEQIGGAPGYFLDYFSEMPAISGSIMILPQYSQTITFLPNLISICF